MLSKKMEQALNDQVKWEYYSGYLYLAMAAYFEELGLAGFANWMHIQEQEERAHAERFYRFLNERGGRVVLQALDAPPVKWDSPLAVFQESLDHERKVTARIGALMDLAIKEKDHATVAFLQWFISEQVEEEASVTEVIQKLKLVESTPGGWFMLDKDLALRVFTPPVIP
ncbi:ferritin-like protein 2 [hydrocarbon metagenome]|uniref:Ferritin-like protein 2 n=1 Tax=hydrocarbon metagenome TaxID=938273 RepID=A0A0W8G223_9ZZZZ